MSVLSTAIYAKNVPTWERLVRIVASAVGVASASALPAPWGWVVASSAVGFALTGLFGFCPACAMIGRRPVQQEPR